MRKTVLLSVIVFAALSLGADAPPPPMANPQDRLVEQLGNGDFRQREDALRALHSEGGRALPALRRGLGHHDPEIRRRCRDLIPEIELGALLAPRRVSLDVDNKPLRVACEEIARQTGYKVEFWARSPDASYSFHFKDLLFWQAIDRVCETARLTLQPNTGDDRVVLQEGESRLQLVRYDGPFRFVPVGIQQTRYLALNQPGAGLGFPPPPTETLSFTFTVNAEPRMPLLGIGQVRIDSAYDTEKNSMVPPAGAPGEFVDARLGMVRRWNSRYGNGNRTLQMQTDLNLVRPSLKASGIKSLRGALPVTLLVDQKPVVVADKVLSAKGKKVTVGSTTFHFEDVAETPGKQFQIKLSVTEDNRDNPNDYTWMNTLYQRIELQDDKGTKYQVFGSSWGNSGPSNVQMTLTYGPMPGTKPGPPARFVFQSWKTLQHLVYFDFRDLPLP